MFGQLLHQELYLRLSLSFSLDHCILLSFKFQVIGRSLRCLALLWCTSCTLLRFRASWLIRANLIKLFWWTALSTFLWQSSLKLPHLNLTTLFSSSFRASFFVDNFFLCCRLFLGLFLFLYSLWSGFATACAWFLFADFKVIFVLLDCIGVLKYLFHHESIVDAVHAHTKEEVYKSDEATNESNTVSPDKLFAGFLDTLHVEHLRNLIIAILSLFPLHEGPISEDVVALLFWELSTEVHRFLDVDARNLRENV